MSKDDEIFDDGIVEEESTAEPMPPYDDDEAEKICECCHQDYWGEYCPNCEED
jgi:hypothetical protein